MLRYHLASRSYYHVIAVTETKLDPAIQDSLFKLPDYTLLRHDRNVSGGGVAFFIHKSLNASIICSSTALWTAQPGYPEYLFCEITSPGINPIFAAVVYRPPKAPFIKDNDFIDKLVTIMHNYTTKIILGDFNADQLSESEDAKFIRKFIDENNLHSIPYGATYHTKTSDTWLDLCLVDSQDTVLNYGQTDVDKNYKIAKYNKTDIPFADGHDLITATLAITIPSIKQTSFQFRDYKNIDLTGFLDFLSTQDWQEAESPLAYITDVDPAIDRLYDHLHNAIDKFVPLKTIQPRKMNHPWFNSSHRTLISERDRLYRRFKRTRHPLDLYSYRSARDLAHESIRSARLEYYFARLSCISDPKLLWKELRHLGICTGPEEAPSTFSIDQLNGYFAGISYSETSPSVTDHIKTLLQDRENDHFKFSPVTLDDITTIIDRSASQARGTDAIPQSVIRAALPVIGGFLQNIFNASLRFSYFPSIWKQSLVRSLNKVRVPKCLGDHRPISLLCYLSKVLERIVYQQMSQYLESQNLIDEFQSGFRQDHSTQTALLKLVDDIRKGIDRGKVTLLLLFDFSKAFDKVCHVTLLKKLAQLGFSNDAITWVGSYLQDRWQAVMGGNNTKSTFRPLNTGVPQGSVLGPLLFAIYINDVAHGLENDIFHIIFADDLQVYAQCCLSDLNETTRRLSLAADHIIGWAKINNLEINVTKTKAIPFGSRPFIRDLPLFANNYIEIGNSMVPFDSSVRSLGVVLDSVLSWKEHVTTLCKRVNSLMYRLNFFRDSTNLKLRKHLIEMLLFPLVDYCSLVFTSMSDEQEERLDRLINTGVRYVHRVSRFEHITSYRRELSWLRIKMRRNYFLSCFLYKLFRSNRPGYIASKFLNYESSRPVRRGNEKPLIVPRFTTEAYRKSFTVLSSYIWNHLPRQIRHQPSVSSFKITSFSYFFLIDASPKIHPQWYLSPPTISHL